MEHQVQNMNNLNQGALSNLPSNLQQASLLATALTPSRKPMDPALLSLLYFSELGKQDLCYSDSTWCSKQCSSNTCSIFIKR